MQIFRQRAQEKQKNNSRQYVSSGSHGAKIFIGCLLVVVPMVVFTIVILALVFSNNLEDVTCPYAEICPQQPLVNVTSKSHYYVDFPAARLVWISSFSSTISFALVGVIMTMFAYRTASQLLDASSQPDASDSLLGPYQTSLLLRILNTDYLSLWDSFMYSRSRSSKRATSATQPSATPIVLRRATIVLCIGIFASIAIQAADGYLHIATKAVEMVSIISRPLDTYQYSKRIGSWCFDQSTAGTPANINFWGCGIRFDIATNRLGMTNRTKFFEVIIDTLDEYVLNYTDTDGTQYAIVGPANSEPGADWKASSFAVSTKCSTIPMSACKINHTAPARGFANSWNCSKALGSPVDLKGWMSTAAMTMSSIDFHKYLAEEAPFEGEISVARFDNDTVSNTSITEANEIWKNPWQWVGQTYLPVDTKELLENTKNTSWQLGGDYKGERALITHCTSTVYDVAYTAVGGKVTSLTKRLSNSTTAGIAIGPTIKSFGFINARTYITAQRANITPNLKSWEAAYAYGMSKLYMAPLAIHTVPTSDQLAQTRVTKIVTQLPAAALWLLVTANMGYAILAAVIAIIAWKANNGAVEQVQVRLGMGGLAAALFDDGSENRIASGESKLFHENESGKQPLVKVSIQPTDVGGMLWMRQAAQPDDWQASEYSSNYQGFGHDNVSDTSKLTSHERQTSAQVQSGHIFPNPNTDRSALLREPERAPAEADLVYAPTKTLYSPPGSRNQWY